MGAICNFVKYQSCHDLASDYGAQRDSFKACVHWDRQGSNQITTLNPTPHIFKDANDWSN
jgi:hypothetical protein